MSPPEEREPTRQRREHRRVATREVTAEVRAKAFTLAYTVVNISTGGLLIAGGRPPPRGGMLEIEIRQAGSKPVHLMGKVVHELPEGIGIAFEPFSTAIAESLNALIAAVEARNNKPPPLPPGKTQKDDPSASAQRPDPFSSGPDPRPPRSGSPDERIDYLRGLVKKRDEALAKGRALFATHGAEVDELRAEAARTKAKLDAAVSQLALGEASLAASRRSTEKQQAALDKERATAQEILEAEQRRTLEAIATVAGLEAKVRRSEAEAERARQDAEAAVREAREVTADAAGLKKSREELGAANRKAMEAQVALTKERTARLAAEALINPARAAQNSAEAEAKKLEGEVARLKAKLIAAENALERSATRKAPATTR